jgi:hypothetical protein
MALRLRPDQALIFTGWPSGFLQYQLKHGPVPVRMEDLFIDPKGTYDYCAQVNWQPATPVPHPPPRRSSNVLHSGQVRGISLTRQIPLVERLVASPPAVSPRPANPKASTSRQVLTGTGWQRTLLFDPPGPVAYLVKQMKQPQEVKREHLVLTGGTFYLATVGWLPPAVAPSPNLTQVKSQRGSQGCTARTFGRRLGHQLKGKNYATSTKPDGR